MTWAERLLLLASFGLIVACVRYCPQMPEQEAAAPTITQDDATADGWTWHRTDKRFGSLVLWRGTRPGSDEAVYRALAPEKRP